MRWIRIYTDQSLSSGQSITLEGQAARHLTQVLRLRQDDTFTLFNGDGNDYAARISGVAKAQVQAVLEGEPEQRPRARLPMILGQALIKGERMDWAIQKSVELGVAAIAPLISERTEVRLKEERMAKRMAHWRGVIISACEQCGRADVPQIFPPQPWYEWADQVQAVHKVVLIPGATDKLSAYAKGGESVAVAVGPEGGWSETESQAWLTKGFLGVGLGDLVLRAETAALAALAILENSTL